MDNYNPNQPTTFGLSHWVQLSKNSNIFLKKKQRGTWREKERENAEREKIRKRKKRKRNSEEELGLQGINDGVPE